VLIKELGELGEEFGHFCRRGMASPFHFFFSHNCGKQQNHVVLPAARNLSLEVLILDGAVPGGF